MTPFDFDEAVGSVLRCEGQAVVELEWPGGTYSKKAYPSPRHLMAFEAAPKAVVELELAMQIGNVNRNLAEPGMPALFEVSAR